MWEWDICDTLFFWDTVVQTLNNAKWCSLHFCRSELASEIDPLVSEHDPCGHNTDFFFQSLSNFKHIFVRRKETVLESWKLKYLTMFLVSTLRVQWMLLHKDNKLKVPNLLIKELGTWDHLLKVTRWSWTKKLFFIQQDRMFHQITFTRHAAKMNSITDSHPIISPYWTQETSTTLWKQISAISEFKRNVFLLAKRDEKFGK